MHHKLNAEWIHKCETFGKVDLYGVDLCSNSQRYRSAEDWLNPAEQRRLNRCRNIQIRHQFALCRAALRAVLCNRIGCTNDQLSFEYGQHGKPIALASGKAAPVSFNVTHSEIYGQIAVSDDTQVGVDIEHRSTKYHHEQIAKRAFTAAEFNGLVRLTEAEKLYRFFDLWTIKEALIKALGLGFSMATNQFEIPVNLLTGQRRANFRFPQLPDRCWHIENTGTVKYASCLVYELK